jgi:Protein of unknown function (DUF2924)
LTLRIIEYRLQEQKLGGLSDASRRRLRQLTAAFESSPKALVSTRTLAKPGTRLVRQWKDQVHVVNVEAKGYEYKGARYESLSEIARLPIDPTTPKIGPPKHIELTSKAELARMDREIKIDSL